MDARKSQNPTPNKTSAMNIPTCSCATNRPYALRDPNFTYEYQCVLHAQRNAPPASLPALHHGRSIVFGMDRPVDWDTLDDSARQARRRQALTNLFGAENLWFEEDRSDLRGESRITAWRNDYYGSFEVVEHEEFEDFLRLGHTLLRALIQMRPTEIEELPLRESEHFHRSIQQREEFWQNYIQPRLRHAIYHRAQPSVLSNVEIQRTILLIERGHHFFPPQESDRLFRAVLSRSPLSQPASAPQPAVTTHYGAPFQRAAPAQSESTVAPLPSAHRGSPVQSTPGRTPRYPGPGNAGLASRLPRPIGASANTSPAATCTVNPAMTMDRDGFASVTRQKNDAFNPRPHAPPITFYPNANPGRSKMPGTVLGGGVRVPGYPAANADNVAHQPLQTPRNAIGYGQTPRNRSVQNNVGQVQTPRLIAPGLVYAHQHGLSNSAQKGTANRTQSPTLGAPPSYHAQQRSSQQPVRAHEPSNTAPAVASPSTPAYDVHGVEESGRSRTPSAASSSVPRNSSNTVSPVPRESSTRGTPEFAANVAFGATLFDRIQSDGRASTSNATGSPVRLGTVTNLPASRNGSSSPSQQGSLSPVRTGSLQTRTPSLASQNNDAANMSGGTNQPGVIRDPVTGQLVFVPRSESGLHTVD